MTRTDAQDNAELRPDDRMGPCPGCDWFDPTPGITYADISLMVRFMADELGQTADEIAYAVEKPWKHADTLAEARAWVQR